MRMGSFPSSKTATEVRAKSISFSISFALRTWSFPISQSAAAHRATPRGACLLRSVKDPVGGGRDHLRPCPAEEELGGVVPQPDLSLEVGKEDHGVGGLQDGAPLVRFPAGPSFLLDGEGDSRDGFRVSRGALRFREV